MKDKDKIKKTIEQHNERVIKEMLARSFGINPVLLDKKQEEVEVVS